MTNRISIFLILAAFFVNSCTSNPTLTELPLASKDDDVPSNPSNPSSPSSPNNKKAKNVGLIIIKTIEGKKHVLVHMRFDNKLGGPGGAIDPKPDGSVESPEEAGAREAKEEAGLDIPQTELKYLGISNDGVVMLLWEINVATVPGPDALHTAEVQNIDPALYGAVNAGGKHMWMSLEVLETHKKSFLSLFFQHAEI